MEPEGMKKIGYRVFEVRINGARREFRSANEADGDVPCTLGEWATPIPGYGPLTLFTSEEEARALLIAYSATRKLAVVRIEYIPSPDQTVWKPRSGEKISFLRLRPGTRTAKALKPLEVVYSINC